MPALRFDCCFRYPTGFALDFAFEAEQGITAIVGPSGSGKTTVLNLIAGLLVPDTGAIVLHDQTLFDGRARINLPPEKRRIGYVFQDYQLFPHLTVEQNLRYGEKRSRQPATTYHDKIVATLELTNLLKRMPLSLSGGEKQRVALGRAILLNPRLLLLDEPLTALDKELRESIAGYLLRTIAEFRIPTLLVSHDQASIQRLADTTLCMKNRTV